MSRQLNPTSINDLERIRERIRELYKRGEMITVDYKNNHPRIIIEKAQVKISGVYLNFFTIEDCKREIKQNYTVMYVDIITGNIHIYELDES